MVVITKESEAIAGVRSRQPGMNNRETIPPLRPAAGSPRLAGQAPGAVGVLTGWRKLVVPALLGLLAPAGQGAEVYTFESLTLNEPSRRTGPLAGPAG